MTVVKNVQVVCHVCGTEYEGPVLMSSNSMMGKPDIEPLACSKCGAPAKQIHPETHDAAATDILIAILEDKNKAAALLCKYSRNDVDIDKWVKIMTEKDLNEWKLQIEESLKDAEANKMDRYIFEFKERITQVEKLQELSEDGTLVSTIDEITSEAKKSLAEEKSKYQI